MVELSGKGFYGRGLYFAKELGYSLSARYPHWQLDAQGTKHYHVLICSVLCGSIRQMGPTIDKSMKRLSLPPETYDSILGGPHQPTHSGPGPDSSLMHVAYKSSQVYPEFIATYRERASGERCDEAPAEAG